MPRRTSRLGRRALHIFLFIGLQFCCTAQFAPLSAQTFDATNLRKADYLYAPTLIHAGDDPIYARPDFDDSKWALFDPGDSLKTVFVHDRPAIVWYRLHIKVAPNETGLALEESGMSSAFEIYANGKQLITSGSVSPFVPYTIWARLIKRIPDADIATGSVVIAMRVHISHSEWLSFGPGFENGNIKLGEENVLRDDSWLSIIGQHALDWFDKLVGLGLGIVGFALFLAQRHQREYLWLFLMMLSEALSLPFWSYQQFHNIPAVWTYFTAPLGIASLIFSTLMYFSLLKIPFGRWIQVTLGVATAGMLVSSVEAAHGVDSIFFTLPAYLPGMAIIVGVIPVVMIVQLRRGNREAGILLLPALLTSVTSLLDQVSFVLTSIPASMSFGARLQWWLFLDFVGPFTVNLGNVSEGLFVLSLGIIIVLRSTRMSRQQAVFESEMAAAREVQHVILPEASSAVPGFHVESVYEPAQQVGGDFFQILPVGEGGLLVVVGDVSGKGLPAAMLVSVLVGSIRTAAEDTNAPDVLLGRLNERLIGRMRGGFSTALAALIAADGQVSISNAGHLSPYLDGTEIELPGALPLGISSGARYEAAHFHLAPGSRLTFYSDGIVEAQNQKGEMFGFERASEVSTHPAMAIVDAARSFGQQDDMTVVAITRDEEVASAA